MTEPIAQAQVEAELVRLAEMAERVTHAMKKRAIEHAKAESAYRAAFARAVLAAEGPTVAEREAVATLASIEAYEARKLAEATLEAAKEAGRNYRAALDAWRSVNGNLRALVVGA